MVVIVMSKDPALSRCSLLLEQMQTLRPLGLKTIKYYKNNNL
jgi:hypothetical protein